jgi:hypothetical protein
MFIAILVSGIFPETRAEEVVLGPFIPQIIENAPTGPVLHKSSAISRDSLDVAQGGPSEPAGETAGRRDRPIVITNQPRETIKIKTGSAQLLPLEKRAKTVIVGDHNLIDVVVENDRLAVLTAKGNAGLTNIIVLNEDGSDFVWPVQITTNEGPGYSVRIHNQRYLNDYTPYICGAGGGPRCNRIADEKAYIDGILSRSRWDNQNLNYSGSLGGGGAAPAPPPGP